MAQRDQGMRMLINDEEDEEDDDDDDPLPAGNLLSGGGARGDQTGIKPWPAGGGVYGNNRVYVIVPFLDLSGFHSMENTEIHSNERK